MTEAADRSLTHLSPAESRLSALFARPKWLAATCVVTLTGLGWLYLGLMVAGSADPASAFGPGMSVFDFLPRAFEAICRAAFGSGTFDATTIALVALMWGAMVLAMMLPSAAPMIFSYAEIADTAARKRASVVSPFVLAGGYTAVWFGFALVATLAQLALTRAALLNASMASASGLFSGAIFIAAGVYQFSEFKHACLRQCQRPFPFLFTHWETTPRGVFRLGLKQGLYCVGCCWAMMLVMFAVGVMNVIWMAALGVVMTIEKMLNGRRFSHAVGAVLLAAGIAFVAAAFAAHWPAAKFEQG